MLFIRCNNSNNCIYHTDDVMVHGIQQQ